MNFKKLKTNNIHIYSIGRMFQNIDCKEFCFNLPSYKYCKYLTFEKIKCCNIIHLKRDKENKVKITTKIYPDQLFNAVIDYRLALSLTL